MNLIKKLLLNKRLFWWKVPAYKIPDGKSNNFGDEIGPYLFRKITGVNPKHVIPSQTQKKYYISVGSIIDHCTSDSIIWGSGIIHKKINITQPKYICSVRGPRTYKRLCELDIDCPKIYGDPALLMPKYYQPNISKQYKIGIIPHYSNYDTARSLYKDISDIKIIDVFQPVESVIDDILSCEVTLSSSLHGIILSHAYGISSSWIIFKEKLAGDNIKFIDYYESLNIIAPEVPNNLNRQVPLSLKELMHLVSKSPQPVFPIDVHHILESCPFLKKNRIVN